MATMYHAPLAPYQIQEEMARAEIQKQQVAENAMKLQELKRIMGEAELARQVKRDVYSDLSSRLPSPMAQPQANMLMPGESGGMPTGPAAPQFQTEDFWKGVSPNAPEPVAQAPKERAPILMQYQESAQKMDMIGQQIFENNEMVKALKAKGLVDEAEKYMQKGLDLQNKATSAHKTFLENTVKTLDLTGSFANGYLQARGETPEEDNRAWARFVSQLQFNGLPAQDLAMVPPAQREDVAKQMLGESETGKERARLEQERLRQMNLNNRASAALEFRNKSQAYKEQEDARKREDRWSKQDQELSQQEFSNARIKLNSLISSAQADRRDVESQVDNINLRIAGLRSGTILTDSSGNKLDKEGRIAEVTMLESQVQQLETQRAKLSKEINEYETSMKNLKLKPGSRGKPTDTGKPETTPTPTVDKAAILKAAKAAMVKGANPEEVKSRYKTLTGEEYPE